MLADSSAGYTHSFILRLYIAISKLENITIKMIIPTIKNTSYFMSFKVSLSDRVIFKKQLPKQKVICENS